jgi:hypothetical protein
VLAPNLPSGGAQGLLSGRRYPQPRLRGMAPWNPQKKTLEVLAQVDAVLVEYEQYLPHLPLTVRQIFYRLVGKFDFPKDENAYGRLAEYLDRARRAGRIAWESIRDDGLTFDAAPGFGGPDAFWYTVERAAENYILHRSSGQRRHVARSHGMLGREIRIMSHWEISLSLKIKFARGADRRRGPRHGPGLGRRLRPHLRAGRFQSCSQSQQSAQRYFDLQPRERRAETGVNASPKGQMLLIGPHDVKAVGIGKTLWISVGRIQQAKNGGSCSQLSIADHRLLAGETRRAGQGAVVAQGLFHRFADQGWIVDEQFPLFAVH